MKIKSCMILAFAILAIAGCNIFNSKSDSPGKIDGVGIVFFEDIDRINFPLDPAQIDSAKLVDEQLSLTVSYSGGCQEHIFRLYTWRGFSKSNPPQAEIYLSHDSRNDACEAYITETLQFDLHELVIFARSHFKSPGTLKLKIYAPGSRQPFYPLPELYF